MIDKLIAGRSRSPAPFTAKQYHSYLSNNIVWVVSDANGMTVATYHRKDDAEDAALSRNATDVQERRGWSTVSAWSNLNGFSVEGWFVIDEHRQMLPKYHLCFPDPRIALIEADKWIDGKDGTHEKAQA